MMKRYGSPDPLSFAAQNSVDLIRNDDVWEIAVGSNILQSSEEMVTLFNVTPVDDVKLAWVDGGCNADKELFVGSADVIVFVHISR